jgi:hypothetical protein
VVWESRPGVQARPEELLRRFPARIQQLVERARAAVRAAVPLATEHVRPNRGYLGYRLRHQFVFVEPRQDDVRLGFLQGVSLADPSGLLQSDASRAVRYVVLSRPADARSEALAALLRRAAAHTPARRPPRGRVQLAHGKRSAGRARPSPGKRR